LSQPALFGESHFTAFSDRIFQGLLSAEFPVVVETFRWNVSMLIIFYLTK